VQHQCGFGIDTGRSRIVVVSQGREWLIFCPVNDAEVQLRLRADRTGSPIAVTTKADDLLYGRGHLAVDKDGMLTMLRKVVGFAKSDLGYQDSELAIKQVNDVLAGPAPFAYGGINGFAEFVGAKGSAAARTFDGSPTPEANVYGMAPPEFAHWVAVTGPIGQTPTHYTVPVWTWQTSFTVTIKKSLIGEYFARFALGQVT
jgi:hypothetical protein